VGFRYGARAPLPDAVRIDKFHKSLAFKTLGYIELKKNEDDEKGLIFNPLRDMIFLDQPRTDAGEFVEAMKSCNAQDKLRSIAIRANTLQPASKLQENMSHLNEIHNLELIFVVWSERPHQSKDNERRISFKIKEVGEAKHWELFLYNSAGRSVLERDMESAWITRPGGSVPRIVHVGYSQCLNGTLVDCENLRL